MPENFTGTLDATETQRTALVWNVISRNVPDRDTFEALRGTYKDGGLGIREETVIARNEAGVFYLKKRSFHNIQGHAVTVAVVADGAAELMHEPPKSRSMLVTASLLHDATKRLEIALDNYRNWLRDQSGISKDEARSTITPLLTGKDMDQLDERLRTNDLEEYLNFVDILTDDFLDTHLKKFTLSPQAQETIKLVAGSDSFGGLRKVIYSLDGLFSKDDSRGEVKKLHQIVEMMQKNGKAPTHIYDQQTARLCALLLYCDDITKGTSLVPVNDRLTALDADPDYHERNQLGMTIFGMRNYEAERIADNCTALLIMKELGVDALPDEIPKLILAGLQNRIRAMNSSSPKQSSNVEKSSA